MAKTSGLGDRLFVSGYDLSGDVGSVDTIAFTVNEMDATGINKSARERLQLLADGEVSFNSYHTGDSADSGGTGAHKRLRTLTNTTLVTYMNQGTAGNFAAGMPAAQFNYKPSRGQDGALMAAVTCKANAGVPLEAGRILGVDQNATSTGNGTGLDLGASHGWLTAAFYLHVTAFTGTSVTLLIQTDDNSGFTTPTTFGTFATVSGRTSERLAVASAPERYIRWRASAGTFSNVDFHIAAVRTS